MAGENTNNRQVLWSNLVYYNTKAKAWTKEQTGITLTEGAASEGAAKTYELKQGGELIGSIDIPKELMISSGSVVELKDGDAEGKAAGMYIALVLNNDAQTKIYVPVSKLVDVYKAAEGADASQVKLTVTADSEGHTIKAELTDSVAASLGKADSALQAADVTESGSDAADGTITVKNTAVAVKGYAELARAVTELTTAAGVSIADTDIDALFEEE